MDGNNKNCRKKMPKIQITFINATQTGEIIPPLGILSVASYLIYKKLANPRDIQIIDVNLSDNPIKEILEFKPTLIGISAMTLSYNQAINLAKKIKKKLSSVSIIISGVHISTAPYSLDKIFSLGIIGEGEETFAELVNHFKKFGHFNNHKEILKINGLVFWDKNKLVYSTERQMIEPLDALPLLTWDLLSEKYFQNRPLILDNKFQLAKIGHLLTSRGCPYKCVFCSTSAFWQKARFFSAERVSEEIEKLYTQYGVTIFSLWDDLFAVSKQRVKEIIELLKKKNLLGKVRFNIQGRTNLIDEEMAKLLEELGVFSIGFGFESGSDKILSYLKKNNASVEQNKNAVLLLDKYGVEIAGSFMLGSPNETVNDLEKTLDFMRWLKEIKNVTILWYGLTTPYPKTDLWQLALKNGIVSDKIDWQKLDILHTRYSKKCPMPFFSENVSQKDFTRIWQEAEKIVDSIKQKNKEKNPAEHKLLEEHENQIIINRFKHFTLRQKISKIIYRPAKAFQIIKNFISKK